MRSSNKKTLENIKNETIIPIGFYEYKNSHSIFCRIKEDPKYIYIIPGKRNDFCRFSDYKELVVFKNKLLNKKIKTENISNVVSSHVNGKKVITFLYKTGKTKKLCWAISKKENEWIVQGSISQIKEIGGAVSDYKREKDYFVYYGESSIHAIFSPDFIKWKKSKEPILKPRPAFFDKSGLKFVASKITEKGILVFYDSSVKDGDKIKVQVGAAMFSLSNPQNIIWRSDEPVFEDQIPYEKDFGCKGMIFPGEKAAIYWYSPSVGILVSSLVMPFGKSSSVKIFKESKKYHKNPIINPKSDTWWMSIGALNPAAIEIDGVTHLFFRAIGNDGVSRIGYAVSKDGFDVDEIYPEPVFSLINPRFGLKDEDKKYSLIMYPSGGSWGGCEDPRMVRIKNKIYLTFNMFDNWNNIRVGMVSIKVNDFLDRKWKWSDVQFISPVGVYKNFVLFPEKIKGKYAIFHNLHAESTDRVLIRYVKDINLLTKEDLNFESIGHGVMPNKKIAWHIRMRAPGASPIRTTEGWLLFYHAHDKDLYKYKIGAILLDLDDPTKIIGRLSLPVLAPDMWYENDWKPGIVYVCGTVIKNDTVFIYYGGGDKYICVATVPLKKLLDSLKNNSSITPSVNKVIFS